MGNSDNQLVTRNDADRFIDPAKSRQIENDDGILAALFSERIRSSILSSKPLRLKKPVRLSFSISRRKLVRLIDSAVRLTTDTRNRSCVIAKRSDTDFKLATVDPCPPNARPQNASSRLPTMAPIQSVKSANSSPIGRAIPCSSSSKCSLPALVNWQPSTRKIAAAIGKVASQV